MPIAAETRWTHNRYSETLLFVENLFFIESFHNLSMPAGVAYDGSVWVTAASSVALGMYDPCVFVSCVFLVCVVNILSPCDAVIGTVGLVAAGGSLAARRVRDGSLVLPTMETGPETVAAKRRSQPLQKSSGDEISISKEIGAESVDIISDE